MHAVFGNYLQHLLTPPGNCMATIARGMDTVHKLMPGCYIVHLYNSALTSTVLLPYTVPRE